jgi:hypothetical protein
MLAKPHVGRTGQKGIADMSRQIIGHHRAKIVKSVLAHLVAAVVAPLIIPFTSGWLFFLLHEWFYPSVWGLPPLQSLIGVSINSTAVGYFFTWFYGLPLAVILQRVNRYQISYLLVASSLPALTLPFWQTEWTISVLPVWIAGASTAYVFWLLTRRKARRDPPSDTLTSRAHG